MSRPRVRCLASRRRPGLAELGIVLVLYAAYELLSGLGDSSVHVARDHAADIVALERPSRLLRARRPGLGATIPMLPGVPRRRLRHAAPRCDGRALVWLYRSHPARFPLVRNTLVVATALSLVGYVLYPAAPPRLSGLGFVDTVTSHTHVNLSSDLLGSLYNPFAAVPSMHFGYSLIVGAVLVATPGAPRCASPAPSTRRSCSSTSSRRETTSCSTPRWAASSSSPPGSSPARSSPPRGCG